MLKTGLLHPYPGSKADRKKYPIWDGGNYDSVLEVFCGSGHFTTCMLLSGKVRQAFVADADPAVGAVWHCWQSRLRRQLVSENIDYLRAEILFQPEKGFNMLKNIFNRLSTLSLDSEKAAVSILIRRLTFGGVVRCNKQGELNVALSQDKLRSFQSWEFEWPWFDDNQWDVSVSESWADAFTEFELSSAENAICLIDPPYWVAPNSRSDRRGTGSLTPAYPMHGDPSGAALFDLTVAAVDRALSNPRIKRIVHTNYDSPQMGKAMIVLSAQHNRACHATTLEPLQCMNKQQQQRDDSPREVAWEWGGRRMFGRQQQLSLLEVA
ncbi:MAG: DNA adenine methylase [Cyanobacteria bacterium J06554_11]